jgi:enediyne biosynthesis protein E4
MHHTTRGAVLLGGAVALLCAAGPAFAAGVDGGVTFSDVAAASGITFERHESPVRKAVRDAIDAMSPIPNASFPTPASPQKERGLPGVAIFDYDRDGDLDLYATNGPGAANSLYQNQLKQSGNLTFVDTAASAGVTATAQDSTGACFGDLDNDGDHDLYVVGTDGTGNLLFRNNGNGTFTDITASSGTAGSAGRHASGCSMADVDNDGRLDIFVANTYDTWNHRQPIFGGLATYAGMEPEDLFMNQGSLVFAEESFARGLNAYVELASTQQTLSWAPATVDYDLDGDVDIMTADTQGSMTLVGMGWNRIFENDGTGNFTDVSAARNSNLPGSWMGLAYGDYNCDGFLDYFSTNLGRWMGGPMGNSRWFLGSASKSFSDPGVGPITGSGLGGTPFGWGASTLDFDNDGDQDIVFHGGDDVLQFISADNPGTVLRNDGQCSGAFKWQASAISVDHRIREVHGVAVGDVNSDGFDDIVSVANFQFVPITSPINRFRLWKVVMGFTMPVTVFDDVSSIELRWSGVTVPGSQTLIPHTIPNGNLVLEKNSANNGNKWAQVTLTGTKGVLATGRNNRDGIGAVLRFTPAGGPTTLHPRLGGASHASQNALLTTLGFGDATTGTLEILWNGPDGPIRNRLNGLKAGEKINYPEIPCNLDGSWESRQQFKQCVKDALATLRAPGVALVTTGLASRIETSMIAAFDELAP